MERRTVAIAWILLGFLIMAQATMPIASLTGEGTLSSVRDEGMGGGAILSSVEVGRDLLKRKRKKRRRGGACNGNQNINSRGGSSLNLCVSGKSRSKKKAVVNQRTFVAFGR